MRTTRRRSVTTAHALTTATRELRRAIRDGDPDRTPALAELRDTGWHLTSLTAELTDAIALLAEHTAHHTEHARTADGAPAAAHLAQACRALATLRRALDTAHTAARDYYSALSLLNPTPTRPAP